MRQLVSLVLRLCLTLSGMVMLVTVIGRQQPASQALLTLHLTDCALPCWIGIVPGQTPIGDARYRLAEVFGLPRERFAVPSDNVASVVWVPLPDASRPVYHILVYFDSVQNITRRIDVPAGPGTVTRPDGITPSLGDVVSLLGAPSCVLATPVGLWNITYKMPGGVIVVRIRGRVLQWTQPVDSLSVERPDTDDLYCRSVWRNASWRGLITLERYQRGLQR
jgi:hypothetical protein